MICSINFGGITISNIPFLYSAESGKNNWWRYFLTIMATWGVQAALSILIGIILVISLIIQNGTSVTNLENYFYDPFVLLPLTFVGFSASYIVLYLCTRFIHNRKFISFININSKINWGKILKGAVIWLVILGVFTGISFLIDPNGYNYTFNPNTFGIFLIICLITFPVQASFEEVFFRGYLMQGFGLLSKKPIIPLLATSIIFGLVHSLNGSNMTLSGFPVIEASIIGIMLGIITLGENSIETATGIHIINNLYVALVVSAQDSVLGNVPSIFTAPSDPYSSILWTVIFAVIALIIIFWGKMDKLRDIFRWEDSENENI